VLPVFAYNEALFNNKFLSKEGRGVNFYPEGTQLRAEVEEEFPGVFSQLHHLPVGIAQGKSMEQVMNTAIDHPNRLIHVQLPKGKQPGHVYIGNAGLMGGGNTDNAKGKERLAKKNWQEKHVLTDGQIVSKKKPEVTSSLTLLHMAAVNGDLATVRSLLLQEAPINARGQLGLTPLHLAAYKGHTEIVRLLLEQGANPSAVEYNGMSALHFASLHGHVPAVSLLLQATDVNVQDKDGYTPLFLAIRSENMQMIGVLISKGADVNMKNKLGNTPLYEAVRRANLVMVKLLRNEGADMNVQNIYGWTPLHLAAHGLTEIVQYLIASGVDITLKNIEGLTSAQLALQERQVAIAELILKTEIRKH
jgi:ankyrin repeat protein